ncbi:MAG TPA: polymer-forming cytoskeletal protein [Thermoanaerobaculia bacterium]|nr:polymer-forming cytoskeletal protein [Thermoanaerobaculia bacterium]
MVWKKSDDQPNSYPEPAPAAPRPMSSTPTTTSSTQPEPRRSSERATIGASIIIKGDLSGGEDLVIEGRVDGKVDLKQHNVTVGPSGRVKADIFGKVITIEGEVDGNVFAQEQAILRQAGAIRGNITAPRVVLEDGSRFKGSIDMEIREAGSSKHESSRPERERPQPVEAGRSQAGEPAGASRAAQAG